MSSPSPALPPEDRALRRGMTSSMFGLDPGAITDSGESPPGGLELPNGGGGPPGKKPSGFDRFMRIVREVTWIALAALAAFACLYGLYFGFSAAVSFSQRVISTHVGPAIQKWGGRVGSNVILQKIGDWMIYNPGKTLGITVFAALILIRNPRR